MANREMGEIEVTLKGKAYVLCFDLNALEAICARFEIDTLDQLGSVDTKLMGTPANLKFILACGLRGGGMDNVTSDQAGRLVTLAEMPKAIAAIGEAFSAATKSLEDAEQTAADLQEEGDENPPLRLSQR
jgi:hypothetical protein